jgi:type I restriction enzyme, S subunit
VTSVPLKYLVTITAGQSPPNEEVSLEGDMPFLQGCAEFGPVSPLPSRYCANPPRTATAGSWLVSVRAPVGQINRADRHYGIGRGLASVRPLRINDSFLGYALQAIVPQLRSVATGSTYEAVTTADIGNVRIRVPAAKEQRTIADFLDRETARIDALIAKKERLVGLLSEKHSAIVETRVGEGEQVRLKHLRTYITSGSRGWADYYADDGEMFLRIANVSGEGIDVDLQDLAHVQLPANAEGARTQIRDGDLLVSITALLGAVAVADERCIGGFVNQHVALVRLDRTRSDPRYVAYALSSRHAQNQFSLLGYGGTKQGLSLNDVGEVSTRLPSLPRQVVLRDQMDRHFQSTRRAREQILTSVKRLRELRSSLITAAVTGQIDVPAWGQRGGTERALESVG